MLRQIRPLISEMGPEHAGMHFTADQFERLPSREGFRYELIKGVLHVSPAANPLHGEIQDFVRDLWAALRDSSGAPVFARVKETARVVIEGDPDATTNPEPDVAAYVTFPSPPPESYVGINPALVAEVVSMGSHDKDYARNPLLFERVAEILEYWVVDPTHNRERPMMTVFHRRVGTNELERLDIASGGTYESKNWAGLRIDLSRLWS